MQLLRGFAALSGAPRATAIGILAILLWSSYVGIFRSIAEIFGTYGGAALVFTLSGVLAAAKFGLRWRGLPKRYLYWGGAMFVIYEFALSLSLGLAASRAQSLEIGMLNYLWPSLTIVLGVVFWRERASFVLWPAMLLCLGGIAMVMKGDEHWQLQPFLDNIAGNPVAYAMGLVAGVTWALYSIVARHYGAGHNSVALFFLATALVFWCQYLMSDEPPLPFDMIGILLVVTLGTISATANSCWNYAVQNGNLTLLATVSYFPPVMAMGFASLWLGVTPGQDFLIGVLLVTLGSLLGWWATRLAAQ